MSSLEESEERHGGLNLTVKSSEDREAGQVLLKSLPTAASALMVLVIHLYALDRKNGYGSGLKEAF